MRAPSRCWHCCRSTRRSCCRPASGRSSTLTVTFRSLPEEVRTGYAETLTPRTNRYIPRTLTTDNRNGKQRTFLLLDHVREVFYGGAAGGAKTAGILAAALQYVDQPHYDALLLRENFKQL